MGRKRRKRVMKWLHKWPSLVMAIFIILWAISGVILNHRFTFSSFDVDRDFLPNEHQYRNWNNASLRGSVRIDSNKLWFYGNMGVWQYDEDDSSWSDIRNGFPAGADRYKVNCLIKTSNDKLFCGTRFALYYYNAVTSSWDEVMIPHHDKHVVDLAEVADTLWAMTRSHLWKFPLHGNMVPEYAAIPAPDGYDNKVGLFKTLWVIHSGEIYGIVGKLIVDFVAIVFVFLTVSGLIYFYFPRLMKRRKRKEKPVGELARWNKFSIKWHNKAGIWLVAMLIVTITTGMFLRPPLLIAIASGRVGKIPYSMLDDGNPWYDQFRKMLYDQGNNRMLLATSEGIFAFDPALKKSPKYLFPQPPASVMGYNVFTKHQDGRVLVGSFSGLYSWDLENGAIYDHHSGSPYMIRQGPAIPIS